MPASTIVRPQQAVTTPSASPLAGAMIATTARAARIKATSTALKAVFGEDGQFAEALAKDAATILVDPLVLGSAPAWVALQTAWEAAGVDFLSSEQRKTLGGSLGGSLLNAVRGIRSRLSVDPTIAAKVLRNNIPLVVKVAAAKRLIAALDAEWLPGGEVLDAAIGLLHAAESAPAAPALAAGN